MKSPIVVWSTIDAANDFNSLSTNLSIGEANVLIYLFPSIQGFPISLVVHRLWWNHGPFITHRPTILLLCGLKYGYMFSKMWIPCNSHLGRSKACPYYNIWLTLHDNRALQITTTFYKYMFSLCYQLQTAHHAP